MNILATGLHGLVGSRIAELLPEYAFTNVSRATGVDITNRDSVLQAIENAAAPIVLHLAAKTDVDGCEKDKEQGQNGEAWNINVEGTRHVVEACKRTNKKLLYLSTDFVFDGEKGEYTESDDCNPRNWYGLTKYEGEQVVQNSDIEYAILRIAYPYGNSPAPKKDFVRAIGDRLREGKTIAGVTDHIFTPTLLDDIVMAIKFVIEKRQNGIFHIAGSSPISPYEAAVLIANRFSCDTHLIQKTTREVFFQNRAFRPYNLSLKHDRIKQLGLYTKTFQEGLQQV